MQGLVSLSLTSRHTTPACALALPDLHFAVIYAVFMAATCAAAQEDLWPTLVVAVGSVPGLCGIGGRERGQGPRTGVSQVRTASDGP